MRFLGKSFRHRSLNTLDCLANFASDLQMSVCGLQLSFNALFLQFRFCLRDPEIMGCQLLASRYIERAILICNSLKSFQFGNSHVIKSPVPRIIKQAESLHPRILRHPREEFYC